MRDRWGTNDIGVRGLCEGERIVRDGKIKIGGLLFEGKCLTRFEGRKVIVRCKDCYASEYYIHDENGSLIGVAEDTKRLFRGLSPRVSNTGAEGA